MLHFKNLGSILFFLTLKTNILFRNICYYILKKIIVIRSGLALNVSILEESPNFLLPHHLLGNYECLNFHC